MTPNTRRDVAILAGVVDLFNAETPIQANDDVRTVSLEAERAASTPLDTACRGSELIGTVLWAPPDPTDGVESWEKVQVTDFTPENEYPYEICYLWSSHPEHGVDSAPDVWQSSDFDPCLVVPPPSSSSSNAAARRRTDEATDEASAEELERRDAEPLSQRKRGEALVGTIVWGPPQTEPEVTGWEKIEVTRYVAGREFEYDIKYIWSEDPKHSEGVEDQWESDDFADALVVVYYDASEDEDDFVVPSTAERAAMASTVEDRIAERAVADPLSDRCRGQRLVGRCVWAPPQSADETREQAEIGRAHV
jgi:hypothetical protein